MPTDKEVGQVLYKGTITIQVNDARYAMRRIRCESCGFSPGAYNVQHFAKHPTTFDCPACSKPITLGG